MLIKHIYRYKHGLHTTNKQRTIIRKIKGVKVMNYLKDTTISALKSEKIKFVEMISLIDKMLHMYQETATNNPIIHNTIEKGITGKKLQKAILDVFDDTGRDCLSIKDLSSVINYKHAGTLYHNVHYNAKKLSKQGLIAIEQQENKRMYFKRLAP